jgi:hypothetical protein
VNRSVKGWMPTLAAAAGGRAIEAVAAANGYGLEMIRVPAVLVAVSWPRSRREDRRSLTLRR